ncbi:MAG: hypothetical protein F4Y84_07235 [Caldilineaceae bacterium SB0665_bin_25]|nr:hypothetical protein [Caldilineaceae bacterium SB0665_bin_25]
MSRFSTLTNRSLRHSDVEVVITAPDRYAARLVMQIRARLTLGTLTQLIANSEHYVILSVPFIQENDSVSAPIFQALRSALRRSVNIDIVSTLAGLRIIARMELQEGTNGRIRFYRPHANIQDERRLGSHAKFCVSDGGHAYVGSANLTMPGLSENIEVGVLLHGEPARQIEDFWRIAIEMGLLVEINPNVDLI